MLLSNLTQFIAFFLFSTVISILSFQDIDFDLEGIDSGLCAEAVINQLRLERAIRPPAIAERRLCYVLDLS